MTGRIPPGTPMSKTLILTVAHGAQNAQIFPHHGDIGGSKGRSRQNTGGFFPAFRAQKTAFEPGSSSIPIDILGNDMV